MKGLTDDEFFGTELVESGALSLGSAQAKPAAGIAQNSLTSFATRLGGSESWLAHTQFKIKVKISFHPSEMIVTYLRAAL